MTPPLLLDGVWKSYPGGGRAAGATVPWRRAPRRWVLRHVGLEVAAGEAVAVIGPNGAGKSTLLRVASRLAPADRGAVHVPRDVVSVLTLGDLLDGELTGSENAYTAGVLAGLGRGRARAAVADVLAFAELEAHADRPVRTYSDGMRLRLAFAAAVLQRPRVLVMDEVISVGDARFQARCLARTRELRESGTAVLLASHDLDLVARTCERAAWLDDGTVRLAGEAAGVVAGYRRHVREETAARTPTATAASGPPLGEQRFGSQEATAEDVRVLDADGAATASVASGGAIVVCGRIVPRGARGGAVLTVALSREGDEQATVELSSESARVPVELQDGVALDFTLSLERVDLAPGGWHVDVGLWEPGWRYAYDYHWHAYALEVTGARGGRGPALPPHAWRIAPS